MKNYIKYTTIILSCCLLTGMTGCTDKFEEYNTNPHAPTQEQMKGDNAGTVSILASMMPVFVQGQQNLSQYIDQMVGAEYGGMIANINPWTGYNTYTYNPEDNWTSQPFQNILPQVYSQYNQLKDLTNGEGVAFRMAQLMRIFATLRLNECYGPVPYSKISDSFEGVAYDKEEDLFNYLFTDLDVVIEELKAASVTSHVVSSLATPDYIYQGDILKWAKFANTLKLRMAIRIVNVNPSLAKQKAEEAANDAIGFISSPSEAAWSRYNDGMNPLYRSGETWNGGEHRASANIVIYMNGYSDPRRQAYFTLASDGTFAGARNGVQQNAASFTGYQNSCSHVLLSETDPQLVMSAAESWFLRAEGALRGWNMGGTPQSLYEQGVKISMDEHGTSIGNYLEVSEGPTNYIDITGKSSMQPAPSTISPKWDDTVSQEVNLERILVQKWIANFPNGWETWSDFRRTGYPRFIPIANNLSNDGVTSTRGMRRLPYPMEERNTHADNYYDAVSLLGGSDTGATDLWWAKKN